ncbi:methyltransferase domain-containing protein [Streptomyces luomodiensis]|uniref:Methyltransferase domain-containing protein n=1 Tax=Streptomyces luomodiensis TaxID=3026192 RepID=A0ABY9UQE9_9ACTN|nr:methyltransferase domain-containing protein [Streptomyces sp. SCA4-21]WNE94772.1 methyltransferase domain-containing protein [Streptomyces sp. SCA4-21]
MAAAPHIELDSRSPEAVDGRQIRAVSFQDTRLEYVRTTVERVGLSASGSRALVVGSGRGLLARGLAGLGFGVVAVDPSATATEMAREAGAAGAASEGGHSGIEYRTAPAEELGLADGAFDLAYYADTFEITPELDRVLAEAARVLRPGGVLIYDTVNRTLLSRLIYLGAFQRLPMTRIMPAGRYTAARLRTPAELTTALDRHGLRNEDICDFKPKDPRSLVKATMARRRGRISDEQIPPIVDFVLAPDARPLVTYLGYARKG